jgi:hypothetical protein
MDRLSYSLTVRLPSGTHFWQTERLPRIDAVITYCGQRYRVVSCEPVDEQDEHHYVLVLEEPEPSHTQQPITA